MFDVHVLAAEKKNMKSWVSDWYENTGIDEIIV